jgi:LysM repeat protein
MKILKVVGIVAGVHALALLVIFANPGCSSSKGQSAAPAEPAPAPAPAAAPAPVAAPELALPAPAAAPVAADAAAPSSGILYSPTRPGTPAATALETQPVTGVTPATTYTVVSRDNLSTIAKKNHLKVSELAAANNLRVGSPLHLGQKLIIPSKPGAVAAAAPEGAPAPAAAPAAGPAKPAGESVRYTVKPGETLGAIARKYGVKVGDIARANTISDPAKIHPGQELIIPGGSVRAGKSGAAKAPKAPSAAAPAESAPAAAPAAAPPPEAAPAPTEIPVIKLDDSTPAPAPKP